MERPDYKKMIENKFKYAANSYSLGLMYYVYGLLEGLHMAEAIDDIYYFNTSDRICKDYFNNAAWRNLAWKNICHRRSEI